MIYVTNHTKFNGKFLLLSIEIIDRMMTERRQNKSQAENHTHINVKIKKHEGNKN